MLHAADRLSTARSRAAGEVASLLDGWRGAAASEFAEAWSDRPRSSASVARPLNGLAEALGMFQTDMGRVDSASSSTVDAAGRTTVVSSFSVHGSSTSRLARDVLASLTGVEAELDEVVIDLRWRVARLHQAWAGTAAAAHLEAHASWLASYPEVRAAPVRDALRRAGPSRRPTTPAPGRERGDVG